MIDYLTVEDLLSIARAVVGPDVVVVNPGLLASACHRPQATVLGDDAYELLWDKAAALMVSLVRNHALLDGNKRLGWAATAVFLEMNAARLLPPSEDEAYDLVIGVATGQADVVNVATAIRSWLWIVLDPAAQ